VSISSRDASGGICCCVAAATCTRARTHTHTHTHKDIYTRTHTNTHTHTRASCVLTAVPPDQQQQSSPEYQRSLGQAELCLSRALQLNPKRATTWASLGRLYAAQDKGGLCGGVRCSMHGTERWDWVCAVWRTYVHLCAT